jgi:hypothetical protein
MISSLALHFRRRIGASEIAASQQRSAARMRAHDGFGFSRRTGNFIDVLRQPPV